MKMSTKPGARLFRTVQCPQQPTTSELNARILLVDDDRDVRLSFVVNLYAVGATVEEAENGLVGYEKAIAAWESGEPFDVVLMDLQMPVLDGFGATRQLRAAGYPGPIVAFTANPAVNRDTCCQLGFTEYFNKMGASGELVEFLDALLAEIS